MAMSRTFVLLKPDAVARGLNFEITERFEKRFTLVACRMQQVGRELAEAHYAPLKGSAAFDDAVAFLTSAPAIATVWEGPGAVSAAIAMAGDADPANFSAQQRVGRGLGRHRAAPSTIWSL